MSARSKNSWQTQLSEFFQPHIRNRGNSYFRNGQVRLQQATAKEVKGTVAGGQRYSIPLQAGEDGFRVYCSCPYFSQGGACKHLWAAIRAADAKLAEGGSASKSRTQSRSKYASWRQVWDADPEIADQKVPMPGEFCPFYALKRVHRGWYLEAWERYICKDGSFGKRQGKVNFRLQHQGVLPEPDHKLYEWLFGKGGMLFNPGKALDDGDLSYLLPLLAKTQRCSMYQANAFRIEALRLGRPFQATARYQGRLVGKKQDLVLNLVFQRVLNVLD